MKPQIYLAGPTVFFRNAGACFEKLQLLCARHGMDGIVPADIDAPHLSGRELASAIREANLQRLRRCDGVLADVRPFRGKFEPDSGTVFECGVATALGKPVALYGAFEDWGAAVTSAVGAVLSGDRLFDGRWGYMIEDFGEATNLMLAGAIHTGREPSEAVAALAKCLLDCGMSHRGLPSCGHQTSTTNTRTRPRP